MPRRAGLEAESAATELSDPRGRLRSIATGPVTAALLLMLFWGMALSASTTKSACFDEVFHLSSGYLYWKVGSVDSEQGSLPQRWAALPLWLGDYQFEQDPPPEQTNGWSQPWGLGYCYLYKSGNDADAILFRARAAIGLIAVCGGWVVWAWSRQLFGPVGGMLSLVLYCFCPTMLSHGVLVTADATVSVAFLAATWALWWVLHRLSPVTVTVSTCATTALLFSKMSGLLILPIGLILFAVRLVVNQPLVISNGRAEWSIDAWQRQGAILLGVLAAEGVLVLALLHGLAAVPTPAQQPDAASASGAPAQVPAVTSGTLASVKTWVAGWLPETFRRQLNGLEQIANERWTFLDGELRPGAFRWFYPLILIYKTPVEIFVLLLFAAIALTRWRAIGRREAAQSLGDASSAEATSTDRWYPITPLFVLVIVYGAVALSSNINLGYRHLLPAYLALLVLAGAAAGWLGRQPNWMGFVVVGCVACYVAESLWIRPHYLAYFSVVAGGASNGYRHAVDSSLDWGQDLPALKQWLKENGLEAPSAAPVHLSYFGTGSPKYYGIQAQLLKCFYPAERPLNRTTLIEPLRAGVYCISATLFQGVYNGPPGTWSQAHEQMGYELLNEWRALAKVTAESDPRVQAQRRELAYLLDSWRTARLCQYMRVRVAGGQPPDAQIGYSILVFRLSDADLERAVGPMNVFQAQGRG